jgi:hypothetical protein
MTKESASYFRMGNKFSFVPKCPDPFWDPSINYINHEIFSSVVILITVFFDR